MSRAPATNSAWKTPVPGEDAEIRAWNSLMYSFIRRLVAFGVPEDEAISEMHWALLKAVRTFKKGSASKITWYYLLCYQACIPLRAKYGQIRSVERNCGFPLNEVTEEPKEFGVAESLGDMAMANLGPIQRRVIWMKYYEGKSQRAIAKILDKSPVRIRQIEKQALAVMKKSLADHSINSTYDGYELDGPRELPENDNDA